MPKSLVLILFCLTGLLISNTISKDLGVKMRLLAKTNWDKKYFSPPRIS
jgi:hypothetical protein